MRPTTPAFTSSLAAIAFLGSLATSLAQTPVPTNLTILTPREPSSDPYQGITAEFIWDDVFSEEDAYEIQVYADPAQPPVFLSILARNQNYTAVKAGFQPLGLSLTFRVRTRSRILGDSAWSEFVTGTMPTTDVAIQAHSFHSGNVGTAIAPYQITATNAVGYGVDNLPDGLTLDPATGIITGTPTFPGVQRSIISATDGTSTATAILTFRFEPPIPALAVANPIPDASFSPASAPASIDLRRVFSYSETAVAVRLATNHGPIDLFLFPEATPITTDNFRIYNAFGRYNDTTFHRSAASTGPAGVDIIQTGAFTTSANSEFFGLIEESNIPNEPGFPNRRGTVAMAKGGGFDTAASQFYFNVQDNPGLDTPRNSGGFTVFGRVSDPSLAVLDAIHALPTASYDLPVNGFATTFSDFPTNTALPGGALPAVDDVVRITSLTGLPDLVTYAITTRDGNAVTASVDTNTFTLAPAQLGTSRITITATDLDGNTVDATFTAAVFPNPALTPTSVNIADNTHPAITFPHVTSPGAPDYEVQKSADLKTWATIWQTSDTFTHQLVASATAGGDTTTLTVRSPEPYSSDTPCHLRIKTTYPTP